MMISVLKRFPVVGLGLLLVLFLNSPAWADGGWVCLKTTKEPYKITVFANPAPLRAGPVDFTVLLQDSKTGLPVTDAEVNLSFSPTFPLEATQDGQWLPPCCRLEANTLEGKAKLGGGGNGLLYETRTSLTHPGEWQVNVSILRKGQTVLAGGTIEIEKAAAPWFVYWPFLVLPFLGIVFMVLNGMARKENKVMAVNSRRVAVS